MAYVRNQFRDPATAETYDWPVNHSDEGAYPKTRTLSTGGNTGHTGLIVQQGDDAPLTMELSGVIFHQSQRNAMSHWFALCTANTIIFRDFTGGEAEVIITSFDPVRKRTLRNPRDPSIPLHYWTYTLRMQVITVLSGDWAGVGP